MVLSTARKPEGGFQFISIEHLCAVWCAYKKVSIRLMDVRLWCAAQEMVARRCQLVSGQQRMYRYDELRLLVGGRGGITTALTRLHTIGLLTWDVTALAFPPRAKDTDNAIDVMLAQIPNHQRRVPVPRRLLRFLAKGCSRAVLATILGHLFCCLYYRQGQCRAEGFCKASWIAQVFGVSERAVKSARHRLEALGFLLRTETPQWVRNRYGQKMTINLQWDGVARPLTETTDPVSKIAPPLAPESLPIAPPDSHSKLLPETTHQKPVSDGPTGVLSTLFAQAREYLRSGTTFLEEPPPVSKPKVSTTEQGTPPPTRSSKTIPGRPPHLRHVILPDLQNMERPLVLYAQAIPAHLIGQSEAERLAFVALAHHVLHFRPVNPGGLFLELLRQRRFDFITQEEEDTARRRLIAHVYGDTPSTRLVAA